MHLKGYRVDHRLVRTGSANFSRSGETRQDDDLVAETIAVPRIGRRVRCSQSGEKRIDTRRAWHTA